MRLPLATLEVFTAIAQQGSLRAAADFLGIKPSTVSHQLKSLEDQLDTRLFVRTTRSINLTEAGRALLRGSGPAFMQLTEALDNARTAGHAERGSLKLTMPGFAYELVVGSALKSFCQTYPAIEVDISLTDAMTDILEEELHAGFRLGDRIAHDMIAVRLTPPQPVAVMASPDYIARHGVPKSPRDLLDHSCIRYRFQPSGQIAPWMFTGPEGEYSVDVRGNLVANSLSVSVDLAIQGLGFVYTFRAYCASELKEQRLVAVLDHHLSDTPGLYIYFPREYRTMVPLRHLIDHLKDTLR